MDERGHFIKFKRLHRAGMSVAVDRTSLTSPNGNGTHVGAKHLPDRLPWRLRCRAYLTKASRLVVKKQDDGTYSISKGIAGAFISAFLSVSIVAGIGLLSQRDEITRLRTLQEIQDRTNADMLSKIDQAGNKAMVADRNAARIEGKFDQFALTFSIKNADKAKLSLEPE